jgi:hypothetical protein
MAWRPRGVREEMGRAGIEPATLGLKVPEKNLTLAYIGNGLNRPILGLSKRFVVCCLFHAPYNWICPAICPTRSRIIRVAPPEKLTHADVKKIRRRVRAGEHQTDLATEYGVNRKTIRRRLDELEEVEAMESERVAASRLRRQAAREKQKLIEREQAAAVDSAIDTRTSRKRSRSRPIRGVDPHYLEWLDRPKNMTWRAAAAASGLTRMTSPDAKVRTWVEREDVEARLDQGWLLAD